MIEKLLQDCLLGFRATSILDVGPGYSNYSRIAARVTGATHITYLDCDQKVLDWQTSQSEQNNYNAEVNYTMLGSSELVKLNNSFDIILCQEVLEHLAEADEVLTTLAKHLSVNSRIVITVPTQVSERWLKLLNRKYMHDEPHGHVREFDEAVLRDVLKKAGLQPLVFIPTQPHYFIAHTWLFGTRMQAEGSTGRIRTGGFRGAVFGFLLRYSKKLFVLTGHKWWGRLLPRNYFIVAAKLDHESIS
ncbi:MAG TPA: hypothetical protein DCP92_05460 [Nitrospiraceae bacterium]|jgi:SAM-dependent methyltransferase|nr:hypothetical protein [Nitrospiraceae bacterium]